MQMAYLAVPLEACLIDNAYARAAVGEQLGRLERAGPLGSPTDSRH